MTINLNVIFYYRKMKVPSLGISKKVPLLELAGDYARGLQCPKKRTRFRNLMISNWISGFLRRFQMRFQDFNWDFGISTRISGFQLGSGFQDSESTGIHNHFKQQDFILHDFELYTSAIDLLYNTVAIKCCHSNNIIMIAAHYTTSFSVCVP